MRPLSLTFRQNGLSNPIPSQPKHGARKKIVVLASKTDSYVSPSTRTGATELAALERYSEVIRRFI